MSVKRVSTMCGQPKMLISCASSKWYNNNCCTTWGIMIISNGNRTEWNTIQEVIIGRVISNQWSA